jgi:hypothetical protein
MNKNTILSLTVLALSLGFSFVLTSHASAATYVSSGVNSGGIPAGSDSNPGTISQPFLTPQKCADITKPGDTCYFRGGSGGSYSVSGVNQQLLTITTSGTAGNPITYAAYPGETPIFSAYSGSGGAGNDGGIVVLARPVSYITIDGIHTTRGRKGMSIAGVGNIVQNMDIGFHADSKQRRVLESW